MFGPLRRIAVLAGLAIGSFGVAASLFADDASALRLVPFPKKVELQPGRFRLDRPLVLEVPDGRAELLGQLVNDELVRAGLPAAKVQGADGAGRIARLRPISAGASEPAAFRFRDGHTDEDYRLDIGPDAVVCEGAGDAGLHYAVQTLCQLIRANRDASGVPCLAIEDWPSLRWRCLQDDMTRGPSSTLATLEHEVALGASLKMNLFTYYMEYQYAFKKHPLVGPKDGSLEPEDLSTLVDFAKRLDVDVLGNQQSFGHFERILAQKQYAHLGEGGSVLSPAVEESYRLLDDFYSEVCPRLPFGMFNVCCDETWALGKGPSKDLVAEIGVGGVYVRHIRRVHDLLRDKYQKRMMMWGDIILQHPDKLDQVPKDTVMLTWAYDPRANFEEQIVPFAKSGYEFFVCPGISNWSRILPDFGVATTNIRNFVRDGAKHGALGMLNTSWEDDGEALKGYRWHGTAWGAECAWNASTTTPEDFNRRVGAVLFGEQGERFGQAIALLTETHRLADMDGMNNSRFWRDDFPPKGDAAAVRASAEALLKLTRPAIEHLEACRREATLNAAQLDGFLLGARRMDRIGQRMLDGLEFSRLYAEAQKVGGKEALPLLAKAEALVRANRDANQALGEEFKRIWLSESKPYALDWTMNRYASTAERYDSLLAKLAAARENAAAGKALPE